MPFAIFLGAIREVAPKDYSAARQEPGRPEADTGMRHGSIPVPATAGYVPDPFHRSGRGLNPRRALALPLEAPVRRVW